MKYQHNITINYYEKNRSGVHDSLNQVTVQNDDKKIETTAHFNSIYKVIRELLNKNHLRGDFFIVNIITLKVEN